MSYSRRDRSTRRSGSGKLIIGQLILFFVGTVTLFMSAFGLRDAEDEVNLLYGGEIAQTETAPRSPEVEAQERARQGLITKVRGAYGVGIAVGLVFAGCALLIHHMPVISTVTGLVLYLATTALTAMVDPILLTRGLILRILIVIALIGAVAAAVRAERRKMDSRRRREEDSAA